jgi:hypothetical protein
MLMKTTAYAHASAVLLAASTAVGARVQTLNLALWEVIPFIFACRSERIVSFVCCWPVQHEPSG